ncbi:MAG TPA: acetyltransferase [Longimicrobium sp.]|jgi:sugar O-acyltransferase (sialic acid O-acetyltransferase NeuD family)
MKVLVWGGGGHGKVVADVVRASGADLAGYADADPAKLGQEAEPGGARVIASEAELLAALTSGQPLPGGADAVALAVGDCARRLACLRAAGERVTPPLVHPSAVVSPSARVGGGTVVMPGAVVNAGAVLGEAVIVNSGAVVEHDCALEDGVHLSPGAVLSGGVRVEAESWIGSGAVVIPGIRIGRGAVVGAGAVIIRDVPAGATVVGNPGRIVRHPETH